MDSQEHLGIDIGNVIVDGANDQTDTLFFGDNFLRTMAVLGAFEVIAHLVAARFSPDRVSLISKCGPRIQERTKIWLQHHHFYEMTAVRPEHVHFCLARREKADICRRLGITHFIDDKLEVLSYLTTVPCRYLFHPKPSEVRRYADHLPRVRRVETWSEILTDLLP